MLNKLFYKIRFWNAVRNADKIKAKTKYKCVVLNVKGKPRVYTVKTLKILLKRKFFGKNTDIRKLKELALYTTI